MDINGPIVVGFDGSPDAILALTWGLDTATRTGTTVRVVVAVPDPEEPDAAAAAEQIIGRARVLTSLAGPDDAEIVPEDGSAVAVLLGESASARLLVVGSRGYNRLEGRWLGSVSQHLAGHADSPVAVVRPTNNPRARQILVGIDGSAPSARALEYAAARAEDTGENVVAVYAYQLTSFGDAGRTGALSTDIDTRAVDEAERTAAELVAGVAADHPDVDIRSTAVVGRAGRVLERLSDDASLVVVGSRGRNAVAEIVLGSVSQETLYRAACPVVVVR